MTTKGLAVITDIVTHSLSGMSVFRLSLISDFLRIKETGIKLI